MFRGEHVLGIIPARGGTKRLPGKNRALVHGRSLVHWAGHSAKDSIHVDKTILSTDDSEISQVGEELSEIDEVIKRPPELAQDDSSLTDVIINILALLATRGENYGFIVLLQPTSPLRTGQHIDEAFSVIEKHRGFGAVSVCQSEHPKEWMGNIPEDLRLDKFFKQTKLDQQSQKFETSYQVNGAIYIVPTSRLFEERRLFLSKGMIAYVMRRSESIDIDHQFDLELAEWLLGRRESNE